MLAAAAGLLLAAAEDQVRAEVDPLAEPRQRRRRDDRRLQLRLLPFVVLRELAEQHVGDDEAEDRVAEELHRLVVEDAAARVLVHARAVRQRVLEQPAIAEAVADGALERLELGAERNDRAPVVAPRGGSRSAAAPGRRSSAATDSRSSCSDIGNGVRGMFDCTNVGMPCASSRPRTTSASIGDVRAEDDDQVRHAVLRDRGQSRTSVQRCGRQTATAGRRSARSIFIRIIVMSSC